MIKKIVPRAVALPTLKQYVGQELSLFSEKFGVTIIKEGKINKGWKGHILERLTGLDNNSSRAPNGMDFELKSVPYRLKNGIWKPKETMAITMINEKDLCSQEFFKSHVWEKLKKLICCAVSFDGKEAQTSTLLMVEAFDFLQDGDLISEIKEDYEFIQKKCQTMGFQALTGKDGKWIQARTKGSGGINKKTGFQNPRTRAFYARPALICQFFEKYNPSNALSPQNVHAVNMKVPNKSIIHGENYLRHH